MIFVSSYKCATYKCVYVECSPLCGILYNYSGYPEYILVMRCPGLIVCTKLTLMGPYSLDKHYEEVSAFGDTLIEVLDFVIVGCLYMSIKCVSDKLSVCSVVCICVFNDSSICLDWYE